MTSFQDKLGQLRAEGRHICISLDLTLDMIPRGLSDGNFPDGLRLKNFYADIIEATEDIAAAYKINPAFLMQASRGRYDQESILNFIIGHVRRKASAPEIPIILDGKYGDVYHANQQYASFAFDKLEVDAITVNPYTGFTNLAPFLEKSGKGIIVFCESTGDDADLQMFPTESIERLSTVDVRVPRSDGKVQIYTVRKLKSEAEKQIVWPQTVSERVCRKVSQIRPHAFADIWLTAPGDKPDRIDRLRKIAPDVPFLIPGIGTQGGDTTETVKAAKGNCLIAVGRSITVTSQEENYANTIQRAAFKYSFAIADALELLVV